MNSKSESWVMGHLSSHLSTWKVSSQRKERKKESGRGGRVRKERGEERKYPPE
jgi:hypothetical protein